MFKRGKNALTLSVFILILCFTILMGTTYAWFTESLSSGSNVIVSCHQFQKDQANFQYRPL